MTSFAVRFILSVWVLTALYLINGVHGWSKVEMVDILTVFNLILSVGIWLLRSKLAAMFSRKPDKITTRRVK